MAEDGKGHGEDEVDALAQEEVPYSEDEVERKVVGIERQKPLIGEYLHRDPLSVLCARTRVSDE